MTTETIRKEFEEKEGSSRESHGCYCCEIRYSYTDEYVEHLESLVLSQTGRIAELDKTARIIDSFKKQKGTVQETLILQHQTITDLTAEIEELKAERVLKLETVKSKLTGDVLTDLKMINRMIDQFQPTTDKPKKGGVNGK